MKRRQTSLSEVWLRAGPTSSKKPAVVVEAELERQDETAPVSLNEAIVIASDSGVSDPTSSVTDGCEPNLGTELCKAACCASEIECFQPIDKTILAPLARNDRNFLPTWYKAYPWLSVCTTRKKVFCCYCRYAESHGLLTFSKKGKLLLLQTDLITGRKPLRSLPSMKVVVPMEKLN